MSCLSGSYSVLVTDVFHSVDLWSKDATKMAHLIIQQNRILSTVTKKVNELYNKTTPKLNFEGLKSPQQKQCIQVNELGDSWVMVCPVEVEVTFSIALVASVLLRELLGPHDFLVRMGIHYSNGLNAISVKLTEQCEITNVNILKKAQEAESKADPGGFNMTQDFVQELSKRIPFVHPKLDELTQELKDLLQTEIKTIQIPDPQPLACFFFIIVAPHISLEQFVHCIQSESSKQKIDDLKIKIISTQDGGTVWNCLVPNTDASKNRQIIDWLIDLNMSLSSYSSSHSSSHSSSPSSHHKKRFAENIRARFGVLKIRDHAKPNELIVLKHANIQVGMAQDMFFNVQHDHITRYISMAQNVAARITYKGKMGSLVAIQPLDDRNSWTQLQLQHELKGLPHVKELFSLRLVKEIHK